MSESGIRKGYADGQFGQVHWRALGQGARPDLVCIHPAPFTGVAFSTIMPHLARDRRVIAPDYPGYGGSDPHRPDPSVLMAIEVSLTHPDKVRRIALIDVPACTA